MTQRDPLERYLDDFGDRLAELAPTTRSVRRRPIALAVAVAVAGLVAAAVVLPGSGSRLDPVAQARAALAPPGAIVYMRITSELVSFNGQMPHSHVATAQTSEQWSALDPPRWRVRSYAPARTSGSSFSDEHGAIVGREELSYAHGTQSYYVAQRGTLDVRKGFSDHGQAARVPSLLDTGSGDVQTDLRSMLADGRVIDEGEQQVDGRTVRRLVSETHVREASGGSQRGSVPGRRFVYDVDPRTFAPIQGTLTITIPSRPHPLVLLMRLHVDAYRRIALNATTAKLLQIQTTPRTKVTIHSARELRAQQRRARKGCRRLKDGNKACPAAPPPKAP